MPSLPSVSPDAVHGPPTAQPLLLRRARLAIGGVADVLIADGKIVSVGGHPVGQPAPAQVLDLRGYLLLPSLTEPHVHLDQAFTATASASPGGGPRGAADAWLAARQELSAAGIAGRAWDAVTRYLASGTTAIRAHAGVGAGIGLRAVQALLDVRADLGAVVDIEIVARASAPLTGRAGAINRALLRDALTIGADLAGGTLSRNDDPRGAVELLARVAAETGTGLDVHVGETTGPEGSSLRQIIAIADEGFGYPITVSHVIGPGTEPAALRAAARARIGVVTLPRDSLFQPGRALDVPGSLDAGAPLAAGGDHVQDSVSPMGRADPLETAALLVLGARLTPAAAFASVSSAGRRVMRRPEVMIAAGAPADLVAVRAADLGGAIASGPPDRIVLRGGRVVARTRVSTEFSVH